MSAAENPLTKRNHLPQKQLFEGAFYTLYDDSFVNLSAGVPGPELLRKCCNVFEVATKHRMVSYKCSINIKFTPLNR